MKKENFLRLLIVLLVFISVSLIYFKPIAVEPSSKIIDDYDGLLITWSLNRVIKDFPETLLRRGLSWPKEFFTGNTFYPYPYSHAYSDAFITDGLIALPFVKLFSEPVLAFNINLIVGQILFLFFTYLFLFKISDNFILSFLLSLIWGFSPIRFQYLGHLQTYSLYWVPLAGYFLLNFFSSKKRIYLYLFLFIFLLQTLNSFLPGYFIIFVFLILLLTKEGAVKTLKENSLSFFVGLSVVLLVLFPVIKIYWSISETFKYERPIKDAIHFSLSPEELLTKYPSLVLLTLFAASCFIYFFLKKLRKNSLPFLFISLSGLVMSFGPFLHWFKKTLLIPLPYFVFYYLIPGFKGFRTPSRWIFLFGFGAIAFVSAMMSVFLKKRSKKFRAAFYLILAFLVIISTKFPGNYSSVPVVKDYPTVYSWLKTQPGEVIIELPIYYWGDFRFGKRETYRMLYSLSHGKKMVNGYSGFSPPEWEKLVINLRQNFPSEETLTKIKLIGVNYLVIHEQEFKDFWPENFQEKIAFLKKTKDLREIYRKDSEVVYAF